MTTRKALLATLAVIAMVAAAYWFLVPREKEVLTLTAKVARAERILAVNGRIRPRLQVDIRSSVGGELIALPFDVGDRVENGQVTPELTTPPNWLPSLRRKHRYARRKRRLPKPAEISDGSKRLVNLPPNATSKHGASRWWKGNG